MLKICLNRPREELFDRINRRVLLMVDQGLENEARTWYPHRECNALNTVGYKEWFGCFDGLYDENEAIRLIQRNTRHYAKRQLNWFQRDKDYHWFHPDQMSEIKHLIDQNMKY